MVLSVKFICCWQKDS